eukprot:1756039-Pyramimonas_sp.AAC.1
MWSTAMRKALRHRVPKLWAAILAQAPPGSNGPSPGRSAGPILAQARAWRAHAQLSCPPDSARISPLARWAGDAARTRAGRERREESAGPVGWPGEGGWMGSNSMGHPPTSVQR